MKFGARRFAQDHVHEFNRMIFKGTAVDLLEKFVFDLLHPSVTFRVGIVEAFRMRENDTQA